MNQLRVALTSFIVSLDVPLYALYDCLVTGAGFEPARWSKYGRHPRWDVNPYP